MPLAQTLQKVEEDVRSGDYGKATARLHGLIGSYPGNLELRQQLGELYWNLRMPAMAGRYWYLVENKDERMQAACKRFEEQFGNDPFHMLLALKFKGDVEAIQGTYAGRVLNDLEQRASRKYPCMRTSARTAWRRHGFPRTRRLPARCMTFSSESVA